MKVEIYSDVACPWCYIGDARFERALRALAGAERVEVVYRPFQLDPHAPADATPLMETLRQRFGPQARAMVDRVVASARSEGLVMDFDRAQAANTFDAHRLLELARAEGGTGVQRKVAHALYEAHFSDGRDVSDREVLIEIAAAEGLDRSRARAFLESGEGTESVQAAIEHARAIGITAVPSFVFNEQRMLQGAQPVSTMLQALERVLAEEEPQLVPSEERACGADGCEL